MNLWLDDVRPAPEGWRWILNIEDAKEALLTGNVVKASLDHDLGACKNCMGGKTEAEWLRLNDFMSMPHCSHVGTGYDLVCWMEETGNWPKEKPTVHSANPVGRARMQQAIEHSFGVKR